MGCRLFWIPNEQGDATVMRILLEIFSRPSTAPKLPNCIGQRPRASEKVLQSLLSILLVWTILACSPYKGLEKERAKRAEKATGDIAVAVVISAPLVETYMDKGIAMAAEEINARGGILGRKLRMDVHIGHSPAEEHAIARSIAADPDYVAVIGHPISSAAIPVSLTYQEAGLLFISPGATTPKLTGHGFSYVFRNVPSDAQTGRLLVEFSLAQGFKRMVVIDDESEYGTALASIFVEAASATGINILLRRSYFPWQTDFSFMLDDIKKQGGDAIFLGGTVPQAALVIRQARRMGIQLPFIGGDALDTHELLAVAGKAAEGTIVSSVFDPFAADPNTQKFVQKFQSRWQAPPDSWAALGYDAVYLLDDAFTQANSTVPIMAASFLRFMEDRTSVMGPYSFLKNGDVIGKILHFKEVRGGKFEYLRNLSQE
jgi:branched-chain amino acid transport system substrate-binding protein